VAKVGTAGAVADSAAEAAGVDVGGSPGCSSAGGACVFSVSFAWALAFSIAGADKQWRSAKAVVDGNTVVVSCPEVKEPVAVRYAFTMNPEGCNLYNKEGLPASPFRTDDWD